MINATQLGVENGYPERGSLPDNLIHWQVNIPDSVDYPVSLVNLAVDRGTIQDKLGVNVTDSQLAEMSRMSDHELKVVYGIDIAQIVINNRCPLGRTGINGTGIFYVAGASRTSDVVAIYPSDDGPEIAMVFNRGKLTTPGGFAEKSDRDSSVTALRELEEEVGIRPDKLYVFEPIILDVTSTSPRTCDYGWISNSVFLAILDTREELKIDHESEYAKYVKLGDILKFIESGLISKSKAGYIDLAVVRAKELGLI